VLTEVARIHMFAGTRRTAVELLRTALDQAGDDLRLHATIVERLVNTLVVLREDLVEAAERARHLADLAQRADDRHVLARALSARGFLGGVLGDPDAEAHLEQAINLELEAGYLYGVERPRFNYAAIKMYRDDLEGARSLFLELYREAADSGDDGSLAWTADNLANVEFLAGNWDEALRWADEGDETASHTGQPGQQAYANATRALVHAHRGEVEATHAAARVALGLSGDEVAIGWMNARWALGVLELSLGNAVAAHEHLAPICDHVEREGIGEPGTTRFVFDDIEALVALGALDEAEKRLRLVERHSRRLKRTFALAASARCRGLLATARGEVDAAVSSLGHARAEDETFNGARTLLALGAALRRAKRRREAREAIEQARQAFEQLGAATWAERARDEAARIGGRTSAGDELTPTERKVAGLVAQGLTNREVASTLFVTPKTVEFHLRNVFRKLGVRSRAELARIF
jgi:DNA-binding CsgD family transcriptional regulator